VQALKRKQEDQVVASVAAKLPILGEKGTILDYQDSYKQLKPTEQVVETVDTNGYYFGESPAAKIQKMLAQTGKKQALTASSVYAVAEKESVKVSGLVAGYESDDE
jgi:hypothetical protein